MSSRSTVVRYVRTDVRPRRRSCHECTIDRCDAAESVIVVSIDDRIDLFDHLGDRVRDLAFDQAALLPPLPVRFSLLDVDLLERCDEPRRLCKLLATCLRVDEVVQLRF